MPLEVGLYSEIIVLSKRVEGQCDSAGTVISQRLDAARKARRVRFMTGGRSDSSPIPVTVKLVCVQSLHRLAECVTRSCSGARFGPY